VGKGLLFEFGNVENTLIEVVRQIQGHLVCRTPAAEECESQSENQSDNFNFGFQPLIRPQVLPRIQNSKATEEPITKARNLESAKNSQ
jgi:hypothetical protein